MTAAGAAVDWPAAAKPALALLFLAALLGWALGAAATLLLRGGNDVCDSLEPLQLNLSGKQTPRRQAPIPPSGPWVHAAGPKNASSRHARCCRQRSSGPVLPARPGRQPTGRALCLRINQRGCVCCPGSRHPNSGCSSGRRTGLAAGALISGAAGCGACSGWSDCCAGAAWGAGGGHCVQCCAPGERWVVRQCLCLPSYLSECGMLHAICWCPLRAAGPKLRCTGVPGCQVPGLLHSSGRSRPPLCSSASLRQLCACDSPACLRLAAATCTACGADHWRRSILWRRKEGAAVTRCPMRLSQGRSRGTVLE